MNRNKAGVRGETESRKRRCDWTKRSSRAFRRARDSQLNKIKIVFISFCDETLRSIMVATVMIVGVLLMLSTPSTSGTCSSDEDCRRSGDVNAYCKSNGACRCDLPFFGDLCDEIQCADPFCDHHGKCNTTTGTCDCDESWGDQNCSKRECPGPSHHCSGHGTCDQANGTCTCEAPWSGAACDEIQCPHNCSSHGTCDLSSGVCHCDHGWQGSDCSSPFSPQNCSVCTTHVSPASYCKCDLARPVCQGTSNVSCASCCDPKPSPPEKITCKVGMSPQWPSSDVVYNGQCDTTDYPPGARPPAQLLSPMIYDENAWPSYDAAFEYDGTSNPNGVRNGNYSVFIGVRPEAGAASALFANNSVNSFYDDWLRRADQYRDCSVGCDADEWHLTSEDEDSVCETIFNVPQYQFNAKNASISYPETAFGPVRVPDEWSVDFSRGLNGELGAMTSMNNQGMAIPDIQTGEWKDQVEIVYDPDAPVGSIDRTRAKARDQQTGTYVAKLDTYASLRDNSSTWVIDSTGGLVTSRQFMSGSFEVTAKVPQSPGQVFALWLFNGQETWSSHAPYVDPANKKDVCYAPSDGCSFFNESLCASKDRCPFDDELNETSCAASQGKWITKGTAPFTCETYDGVTYQQYSGDPLFVQRESGPGTTLPQLCKEFPNAEIDWEMPSNAPSTTNPPFTPHPCRKPSSGEPCKYVNKYNTANLNNYRFTDGKGEGTYTNLWVRNNQRDFVDGEYHTYRMEVHAGTETCEPRVDYFFDGEYVASNNAFVPRRAGRFWILFIDKSEWASSSGGWNGMINASALPSPSSNVTSALYSSVYVSSVRITPFFESRDTYGPTPYDQPSMGSDQLADCGMKNPPSSLNSSFVPYFTDGDHPIGQVRWIKRS